MSKTGAPRKAPLNLNALRAQQADARGEKYLEFELTPDGSDTAEQFRVLRRSWWPVTVLTSIQAQDGIDADAVILRELMGADDFHRAVQAGLTIADMAAIWTEIQDSGEGNADLGESSDSSES